MTLIQFLLFIHVVKDFKGASSGFLNIFRTELNLHHLANMISPIKLFVKVKTNGLICTRSTNFHCKFCQIAIELIPLPMTSKIFLTTHQQNQISKFLMEIYPFLIFCFCFHCKISFDNLLQILNKNSLNIKYIKHIFQIFNLKIFQQ